MKHILATVLLLFYLVHINKACFCFKEHPQETYCNSDFAVKVLTYSKKFIELRLDGNHTYLKNVSEDRQNVHLEFEVQVLKTYKGNISDHTRDKIYSPYSGSMCGLRLEINRHYFLTGMYNLDGHMSVGMCGLYMDVTDQDNVTSGFISDNLLSNWGKGCQTCQFCSDEPETCSKNNTCVWNSNTPKLQSALSYCSPSEDENGVCNFFNLTLAEFQKLTDEAVSIKLDKTFLFISFSLLHFIDMFLNSLI